MAEVYVFDVNETLLDLRSLDPVFVGIFGDGDARRRWFSQMLRSAFVSTVTGSYASFGTIGMTALEMTATQAGVALSPDDKEAVRRGMTSLPPHPEVAGALERLRDAGMRLATLTNSTAEVGEAQLRSAGLRDLFELALSADEVRRLKPAPEPYRMAAERFRVDVAEVRLIAAHDWDVAGALGAGCKAAFVARSGQMLDPLFEPPDIVGADLTEVVEQLLSVR